MTKLYGWFQNTLKAHAAGIGAALSLVISDLQGLHQGAHITLTQWAGIAGAYLGVGAVVHSIPNVAKATVGGLLGTVGGLVTGALGGGAIGGVVGAAEAVNDQGADDGSDSEA